MSFHRAGQVHFCFLDQQAANLGESGGALPTNLFGLPVQRQIDQGVVTEQSAHLNSTGGVSGEAAAQYLDVITSSELFGGTRDLRAFGVGVRQAAFATGETDR